MLCDLFHKGNIFSIPQKESHVGLEQQSQITSLITGNYSVFSGCIAKMHKWYICGAYFGQQMFQENAL